MILFLWVIFALNTWPSSTVRNIANLNLFILKSRNEEKSYPPPLSMTNVWNTLHLCCCNKNRNEYSVTCAFAETENMRLHITQLHVIQKSQDPECLHGARE